MSAVPHRSPDSSSGPFNTSAPLYSDDPANHLIEAARRNDIRGMFEASKDGANKNATGRTGENVYTAAAQGNALSAIDYAAMELHAHIDIADRSGRTGLLISLQKAYPQAAAKFLAYGANPLEVGRHANYRIIDCFLALEEALQKDNAVQDGIVNAEWSPVVGGMIHRLFNPNFWPDDKGAVWDRHIPEFIRTLTLSSGVTVAEMREQRAAAVPKPPQQQWIPG